MDPRMNDFDMLIVGAGFAGLYQLHRARSAGMRVRLLEAGKGIGGTWFWNRYPGARCDIESLDYSYSFSRELEQEWVWSERYAAQPEILSYIDHVADRFGLRQDIQLQTRVSSAVYDAISARWKLTSESGQEFVARFVVMATGVLSVPQSPDVIGISDFRGPVYHSARWPEQSVDFSGRRVALIGTGSSGVQLTPQIAAQARQLIVFQRTANFSVPAHNAPFTSQGLKAAKARYAERRAAARDSFSGQLLSANPRTALEMTPREIEAELEYRWNGAGGGFRMSRTFADQMKDESSNRLVGAFARAKIKAIVKDPKKAEVLCPAEDLLFGTKRVAVDTGYYETFNRDNVDVVDLNATPIVGMTASAIVTSGDKYEVDAVVFATGFDAVTGALSAIDIRGIAGLRLRDHWRDSPKAYLGLCVAGFPNFFVITGPGSPSVLSNVVHSIEVHVDWIMRLLAKMNEDEKRSVVAREDAEGEWTRHCAEIASRTLFPRANSWWTGANVPGKPRVFLAYVGGVAAYRRVIDQVEADGYAGLDIS